MVNLGTIRVVFYVSIYQNASIFQETGQRNEFFDFSSIALPAYMKFKIIKILVFPF
jgi:hypothetical protein